MKYVAFLRGINVGGRNMIKMSDLKRTFEDLGFKNVSTFLQSGNVLFESSGRSHRQLVEDIEKVLPGNTRVAVRSASGLGALVAKDPFTTKHAEPKRRFVTFLQEVAWGELKLKPGIEIVFRNEQDIVCYVSPTMKRFEYPNIEAQLKVPATTRSWGVVQKLAELCSSHA